MERGDCVWCQNCEFKTYFEAPTLSHKTAHQTGFWKHLPTTEGIMDGGYQTGIQQNPFCDAVYLSLGS
eukprot:scaffold8102_cov73-Cyclotella_meneghiniana.AAC.24